jgi:beta-glucosidase-like glycosyl hydrolase
MSDHDDSLTPDVKFQLVRKLERHTIIGLAGPELIPHEAKYLEFHKLSGIILFQRNVDSLSQVSDLVAHVGELLDVDGLPPLIMVDHEGDFVSELKQLIGVPPSAMAIAATGDVQLAHDVAFETGQAMQKLGVNAVLAPVADCYLDPESPVTGLRTFGRDPERVAEFVEATITGFHEAGILACVKHFPGHGGSGDDSHETMPVIRKSVDELWAADIGPFDRAVKADVDMVMMAHVAYTLDDADHDHTPASFDARVIRGLLRDTLGFGGVVITDALEMEGARQHARSKYGGLTGGFERAILAGTDLLLYSQPIPDRMSLDDSEPMIAVEVMQTIIETLSRVVDRSRIDAKLEEAAQGNEGIRNLLAILDASHGRIESLRKKAAGSGEPPAPLSEGNVIHLSRFASTPNIYAKVASQSVVLARDPESFVPVGREAEWILVPIEFRPGEFLKGQDLPAFMDALCRVFPSWRTTGFVAGFDEDDSGRFQPVFSSPDRKVILDAQRAMGTDYQRSLPDEAAVIPVVSYRAAPSEPAAAELTRFVEDQHTPLVIITGAPLFDWVPESVGCLVTLGASTAVGNAAAAVLAGEAKATGVLDGLL